jgi:hypothetical protein
LYDDIDLDQFLTCCNEILTEYRVNTKDVFLAPFKNLRKDGVYRRRLDFATAKLIMSKAAEMVSARKETSMPFQVNLFDSFF